MRLLMKQLGVFILQVVLTFPALASTAPAYFAKAKRVAADIFKNHRQTLYCNCRFNPQKTIDLASCHLQQAQNNARAHRLEWEHIMPAENFGRQFVCWRKPLCKTRSGKSYKGRACCARIDSVYRQAEAELYNLWPEVGLLNQLRSNYRYAQIPTKVKTYGCDFYVDRKARKVEPSDRVKGLVARANLFMSAHYKITLSPAQRHLFEAWDKRFPPDSWEKEWAEKVANIEGYTNPYINR